MTDINDTANTAMEELEDPTNPGGQPPAETLLADLLDQEEAQETEEQESPAGMEEPDALDVEGVEEEEVDPLLCRWPTKWAGYQTPWTASSRLSRHLRSLM
jgi:hypothetical protein